VDAADVVDAGAAVGACARTGGETVRTQTNATPRDQRDGTEHNLPYFGVIFEILLP
jgi:hypothetical protein